MSCHGWERGSLKIPTREWTRVRNAIVKAFNDHRQACFNAATQVHGVILAREKAAPGLRNNPTAMLDTLSRDGTLDRIARACSVDSDTAHDMASYLYVRDKDGQRTVLARPLKKNFAPVSASHVTALRVNDEASISINSDLHTIGWSVSENNHAVEAARESAMGCAFFRIIGSVTWTRGSGGTIVGNDEYNRDCDDSPGAGGNYITAAYGPLGEQARAVSTGFSRKRVRQIFQGRP